MLAGVGMLWTEASWHGQTTQRLDDLTTVVGRLQDEIAATYRPPRG